VSGYRIDKVVFVNIGSKIGKLSWMDAFGVAGSKILTEKFLAKWVGNGTLKSAVWKGGLAFAVDHFAGDSRIPSYVKTGLVVDAAEDVVTSLLGSGFMGMGSAVTPADNVMVV
jgi:hypothetical protein